VYIIAYLSHPSTSNLTATSSLIPFFYSKKARRFEEEELITISNVVKSEYLLIF